jgi:hypothetical protein
MKLAPIALFCYKRLHHLQRTMAALQLNILAKQSELHIFSDGPKSYADYEDVNEIRKYLKNIRGFKSVSIRENTTNKGLSKSITNGVAQILKGCDRIIVLEDDIVTSPCFLSFMNNALETYQDENRVMQISGYMYPIQNQNLPRTFFLKLGSSWGWATWRRAWNKFEKNPDRLIKIFTKKMIKEFNYDNSCDFWKQVIQNKKHKINTWSVFWDANIFLNNGLVLYPKNSFVENIGFDNSGEHCEDSNNFKTRFGYYYDPRVCKSLFMSEDSDARKEMIRYFKSIRKNIFQKILRRIFK